MNGYQALANAIIIQAAKDFKIRKIAMAGGVASNSALRAAMQEACKRRER